MQTCKLQQTYRASPIKLRCLATHDRLKVTPGVYCFRRTTVTTTNIKWHTPVGCFDCLACAWFAYFKQAAAVFRYLYTWSQRILFVLGPDIWIICFYTNFLHLSTNIEVRSKANKVYGKHMQCHQPYSNLLLFSREPIISFRRAKDPHAGDLHVAEQIGGG